MSPVAAHQRGSRAPFVNIQGEQREEHQGSPADGGSAQWRGMSKLGPTTGDFRAQ